MVMLVVTRFTVVAVEFLECSLSTIISADALYSPHRKHSRSMTIEAIK